MHTDRPAADRRGAHRATTNADIELPGRIQRAAGHGERAGAAAAADADLTRARHGRPDLPGIDQSACAPGPLTEQNRARRAGDLAAGDDHQRARSAARADADRARSESNQTIGVDGGRTRPAAKAEGDTDAHLHIVRGQIHDGSAHSAKTVAHFEEAHAAIDPHPEAGRCRARAQGQRAVENIQFPVAKRPAADLRTHRQTGRQAGIKSAAVLNREQAGASAHSARPFADAHFLNQHRLREHAARTVNGERTAVRDRETARTAKQTRRRSHAAVVVDGKAENVRDVAGVGIGGRAKIP